MSFQSVRKMCLKYVVFTILFSSLVLAERNSESILSKMTWDCANNASCFNIVKNEFIHGLQQRRSFNFDGLFSIEPVGDKSKPISEGRGFMSNLFTENALRIPFGGLALTIQRAEKYPGYLDVAIVKNDQEEARRRGGLGGAGGGLGGHGGLGGGGGGGGLRKSKKYVQTFIPLFLAFNAVGWMLLAVKAVAVLTVKALVVSKLALLVAGTIVFKKLMDSATEKMIGSHSFDHSDHGLVGLPYNMEYALPSHNYHTTAELNGGDLFSMPLQQAAQDSLAAQPQAQAATFTAEAVPAESQLNPVVASFTAQQKSAQITQPILGSQSSAPKVKRQDDIWTGYLKKPMFYNGVAPAHFYG